MEVKEIESAIEGILFAAGDPVGVERLCMALDLDRGHCGHCLPAPGRLLQL